MDTFQKYILKKHHSIPYYIIKYNIEIRPNDNPLTRKEILEKIHHYEMKNMIKLINDGNDPATKEIGYFIQS
jgi:hypothetical protein